MGRCRPRSVVTRRWRPAGARGDRDGGSEVVLAQLPWTEAIRTDRWKEAEEGILALPEGEQNKPEVRFARARVSLALGKHADAVARLEKLEDDLPLLRDRILKTRALAALVIGPYDLAASFYAARPNASSWLVAAETWEKAGEPARARAQCDRILGAPARSKRRPVSSA